MQARETGLFCARRPAPRGPSLCTKNSGGVTPEIQMTIPLDGLHSRAFELALSRTVVTREGNLQRKAQDFSGWKAQEKRNYRRTSGTKLIPVRGMVQGRIIRKRKRG